MVAVNTAVEVNRDGLWTAGIVIAETPNRLVIAVCGNPAHRAYVERPSASWRTIRNPSHVRGKERRQAIQNAHNVFARAR